MEIIKILPLVESIPVTFSPTYINSMLKCPLRGRYDNRANYAYKPADSGINAKVGNVIHSVFKDLNDKTYDEMTFDQLWANNEIREAPDGLKEKVLNFGRMKYMARLQAKNMKRPPKSNNHRTTFYSQEEKMLFDESSGIKGKPDVVLFYGGLPYEVKDYKTGQVLENLAEEDERAAALTFENVKADYKNQLYFYAYLIKSTYGTFPESLTIIPPDGHEITTTFVPDFMNQLLNEFFNCKSSLSSCTNEELARPSDANCRYCLFKAGCPWCYIQSDSPVTDLNSIVEQAKIYPYGNFSLLLENGQLFFYQSPAKVSADAILQLKGQEVFICNVRKQNASGDLFLPTRISRLYVKGKAA